MSEVSVAEIQENKPHIKAPWQREMEFWKILNERVEHGPDYSEDDKPDGEVVVRSFLYQESNAGVPGKEVGGAAVAMNDVIRIMQDQLGIKIASASINPDSVDQSLTAKATELPFAAEYMPRPFAEIKSKPNEPVDKNADLVERLLENDVPTSYIEYAAMLMNGTDVIFPNYWAAGVLAVRAKEYLEQLQDEQIKKEQQIKEGKPIDTPENDNIKPHYKVWKIPKIVYCNHSLPARIDEKLSQEDPDTYKAMDQRRKDFQEEIYQKADAIMVWTQAEKDLSKIAYADIPDIEDRMHVVKAPVRFDSEKAKEIRPAMRKQFFPNAQLTENSIVYYYQGRFENYKHPEILLQSFIDLYQEEKAATGKSPDIACLLVGGPFTDKEGNPTKVYADLLKRIDNIPAELKEEIKARISMPGSQPKEAGHAAGDILVFPSIKESLGLTLVEAVMSGNLAIARKSVPTVIEANGDSGFNSVIEGKFKEKMAELLHATPETRKHFHDLLQKNAAKYTPEKTAADIRKMFASPHVGIELKKAA